MSEATTSGNANNTNNTNNTNNDKNIIPPDQIEETLLWNIQKIEERQKACCIPDSIEKALAGVEEALTSVQSALGKTTAKIDHQGKGGGVQEERGETSARIQERIEEGVKDNRKEESRNKVEDFGEICDMSPKEDLNLPASAQNDSDSEPIEEPLVGTQVASAEDIDNEAVPAAASNTVEKATVAAVSPPEPIMEKPEEIVDVKDEDSEETSLQESIVIGTVQITDTVQIDQEVYNEKKEKEEAEPSVLEEIKECVIETTSKIADDIAKILDEPEDQAESKSDTSNILLEAIEKESKDEENVTESDGDVEKETVISSVKFAHELSENRRGSTFLTELDENDENDKIVEEKVEHIVEKVVAEHSSAPSADEKVSKEDETVVEKLLGEFQTTSETQSGPTEEISSQTETIHETPSTSQTETIQEISSTSQTETVVEASSTSQTETVVETTSTSQTEPVEETSSTSQTEPVEETSSTCQTEPVEETSSTSQTEPVHETSSTSQTEPVEKLEVFEKTSQTVCSIEPYAEKVEIIEEPIIEILQTESESLEENDDEKVEELARNICSNMEEPTAQLEKTEELPIGAIAVAVLAIFLALIIFYR